MAWNRRMDEKETFRYEITNGMIINFRYKGSNYDKRPLVFVMDTDEYVTPASKKSFSGVNLNYLTISEINLLFIRMLNKVGWELDRVTRRPKVDLWDDEEMGLRPQIIYDQILKTTILKKRNCWRKYKHEKISQVEQVTFNFNVSPLNQLSKIEGLSKVTKSDMEKMIKESKDADKL